ncbi:hypothetical protein [Curtobacterium sp. MCLR17_054]|uniref:hypothetical protein n=1 Tax=Curtobacterium sp. MCLR17_054 TaxID=2175632 RepID=UPI000DA8909B|nr:hypothetical protein [Curtobacterium sp. MCLR17_054]WIE70362.1 hypothetical protein DEJ08_018780 [Curtobacterium sp. MCLR17_054]
MSIFPEPGRLAAHVLLDAVAAVDLDNQEALGAPSLAYQRLIEIPEVIEVLRVSIDGVEPSDDAEVQVDLDLSNLLGASLLLLHHAADVIAAGRGIDREVVVAELREYSDL